VLLLLNKAFAMTSLFHEFTKFYHYFNEQGNPYVLGALHLQHNLGVKPQTDYIAHDVMHDLFGFKLPANSLLGELLEDPGELAFTSHFAERPFRGNQLRAWRDYFIAFNSDFAKVDVQPNEKIPPPCF
jgi:hypothetical protein